METAEVIFMIIDTHVHLGKEKCGFYSTKQMVLEQMKMSGIDRAVIFPLDDEAAGTCFSESNKHIAEACRGDNRFIGFMRLDPNCDDETIKKTMEKAYTAGLRGIKLHPNAQNFKISQEKLGCIIDFARVRNIPILCHTCKFDKLSDPVYLIDIAKNNPDVTFIAAHGSEIFSMAKATKELDNFYVDTSCITNHAHINFLTSFGNPDKILFGSDFPFSLPEIEKSKIELSEPGIGIPQKEGMPDKIKKKVLGLNADKLFS